MAIAETSVKNPTVPTSVQEFPLKGDIGVQFGRVIYTAVLRFDQAARFLKVFGEVQRDIDQTHVRQIAKYFSAVMSGERSFGIVPAMTVTARGPIRYDKDKREVVIDYRTVLSVNDGQHRLEAIVQYREQLQDEIQALSDSGIATGKKHKKLSEEQRAELIERLTERLAEFDGNVLTLQILDNVDAATEQQAFADVNAKAKKAAKSVVLKYDHTDLNARVAHEIIDEMHLDSDTVATDAVKLDDSSRELITFSTMAQVVKELLGTKMKLTKKNFEQGRALALLFFCMLFPALPKDAYNRKKYIVGNSLVWNGVARWARGIYADPSLDFEKTVANLANVSWEHSFWKDQGFPFDPDKGRIILKGSGSIPQIALALESLVEKVTSEGFLVEETDVVAESFEEEVREAEMASSESKPNTAGTETTTDTPETSSEGDDFPFSDDVVDEEESGEPDPLDGYDFVTKEVYRLVKESDNVLSPQEMAEEINIIYTDANMTRAKISRAIDMLRRDGLL